MMLQAALSWLPSSDPQQLLAACKAVQCCVDASKRNGDQIRALRGLSSVARPAGADVGADWDSANVRSTWQATGARLVQLMQHDDHKVALGATAAVKAFAEIKELADEVIAVAGQQLQSHLLDSRSEADSSLHEAAYALSLLAMHGSKHAYDVWQLAGSSIKTVISPDYNAEPKVLSMVLDLTYAVVHTADADKVACIYDEIADIVSNVFQQASQQLQPGSNTTGTLSCPTVAAARLLFGLSSKTDHLHVLAHGTFAEAAVSVLQHSNNLHEQGGILDVLAVVMIAGTPVDVARMWEQMGGPTVWLPFINSSSSELRMGAARVLCYMLRHIQITTEIVHMLADSSFTETVASLLSRNPRPYEQHQLVAVLSTLAQRGAGSLVWNIVKDIWDIAGWVSLLTSKHDGLKVAAASLFAYMVPEMHITAAAWNQLKPALVAMLTSSTRLAAVSALRSMTISSQDSVDISVTTYSTIDVVDADIIHSLAWMQYTDDKAIWPLLQQKVVPLLASSGIDPVARLHVALTILGNRAARKSNSWRESLAIIVSQLGNTHLAIPADTRDPMAELTDHDAWATLATTVMHHAVFSQELEVSNVISAWFDRDQYATLILTSLSRGLAVWKITGAQHELSIPEIGWETQHPMLEFAELLVRHAPDWATKSRGYPWSLALLSVVARIATSSKEIATAVVAALLPWPQAPSTPVAPAVYGFKYNTVHLVSDLPAEVAEMLSDLGSNCSNPAKVCTVFANTVPAPFGCLNPNCPVDWVSRDNLAADRKLSRCTGCKAVAYCSKECQKAHWGRHQHVCKALRKVI